MPERVLMGSARRARTMVLKGCLLGVTFCATVPVAHSPVAAATQQPPEIGEATDEGDVIIATSSGEPATNGGSTTPFRLLLPEGAACPGDSASGNWLVQTFLIPKGDDPGTIKYGFSGPEGTQFPLYALDTTPVAHQVTQVAATADGEGVINELPEFSFGVFVPGDVPPGEYTVGVACEYYRATARYWDTSMIIEANRDDEPAQLTWRLPDAEPFDPNDRGSSPLWWLAVAGVIVAFVVALVFYRRNPPIAPITTSHSSMARVDTTTASTLPEDTR